MTRSHDPAPLIKASSAQAKSSNFKDAINTLKQALPLISGSPLSFGAASYSKIVPYFQKAGLYKEGLAYTLEILIPTGLQDIERKLSHVPEKNRNALSHALLAEIYGKLRLIAQREGLIEDRDVFLEKHKYHTESHRALMNELYPR
ncbi:hypothetical protein [Pseudomonas sp. AOB-7]|uniref:hypothetical protein n=1 Tax=Pseudomonas sp. AOB-7 TaxID=2482750 RepID=UPI0011C39F22|nr:hypothetical protein [Pseudomonas sp. AOB-7]